MIIQIERSGGFTGIPLQARVDTRTLDAGESRTVEKLVTSAFFFDLPARIAPSEKGADRFQYRIRIESESHSHVVEVSDGAASSELSELIRQVMIMGR